MDPELTCGPAPVTAGRPGRDGRATGPAPARRHAGLASRAGRAGLAGHPGSV